MTLRDDQCRWCGHGKDDHPYMFCYHKGNAIVPRLHDDDGPEGEPTCRCRGWEQIPPDQRASV